MCAGVVAFNERSRIADAVRSLLDQRLPAGVHWDAVHVVVSGSSDGTEEVVRALALDDPRVRLRVEPRRSGKANALGELFRTCDADRIVLLNGDARALPGAVAALWERAPREDVPFGVMGRPTPPADRRDPTGRALRLLWGLHHEFHLRSLAAGSGNHLSDELLLLGGGARPPIEGEVVNDGAFFGGWLRSQGGVLAYAPGARVAITTPRDVREHVRQRRRIQFGHAEERVRRGRDATTLEGSARRNPLAAVRLVAAETRRVGDPFALAVLLAGEAVAVSLSVIDRAGEAPDHARWRVIAGIDPADGAEGRPTGPTADRA